MSIASFERAIEAIEKKVGLSGQPRVVVFHEKNGRRHAHCVWSRIKVDELKAVNLPHFKLALRDLSRDLYLEHGWLMPSGLVKGQERNPFNFNLDRWQQAKRASRDPVNIKEAFRDCWAISDGPASFRNALEARGYYLARGDRRGYVAVDHTGEIYAIARWTGLRTKAVTARLGDPDLLPSVESVQRELSARVADNVASFAIATRQDFDTARLGFLARKKALVSWQRYERQFISDLQAARWLEESRARAARFRAGFRGLWDRITGRHANIRGQNEEDCEIARLRDESERQTLINRQLDDRSALQLHLKAHQGRLEAELASFTLKPKTAPVQDRVLRRRGRTPARGRHPSL